MNRIVTVNDTQIFDLYEPGDQVYLTSSFNELDRKQKERFHVQKYIPTTNRGIEKQSGWLGCTDGCNSSALGLFEIEEMEIVYLDEKDPYTGWIHPIPFATKLTLSEVPEGDDD